MSAALDKKLLQVSKFIQKGQFDRAVKEYEKLLSQYKKDPKILNSLGDTYIKMNMVEKAMDIFNDVAEKYIKDGFMPNAIAIYRKMLRFKPNEIAVKLKIADLYVKTGMISEAEFYYNQYADYFVKRGEIIKAIPAYEKICAINPDNVELRKILAGLYFRAENIDKMFSMYQEVFDYFLNNKDDDGMNEIFNTVTAVSNKNGLLGNKTYYTMFVNYILYLFDKKEYELAKNSVMDMANIYLEMDDRDKAVDLYKRLLEKDERDIGARIKLIEIYKKNDNTPELVCEYLKMAEYLKEDEPERANVIYSEILQLDPENIEARTALNRFTDTPPREAGQPAASAKEEPFEIEVGTGIVGDNDSAPETDLATQVPVDNDYYGTEASELELTVTDADAPPGEEVNDGLRAVSLGNDNGEKEVEEAEPVVVSGDKGFFGDDDGIEFTIEVGKDDSPDASAVKSSGNEDLESALSDLFAEYGGETAGQQSLVSNINDLDGDNFIPTVDEIVNTFKRGLEEQLEGDPQAHYDMGIAFKEMGLYDSAVGEFRKLSLLPAYRFKSINLMAQCYAERGEYQRAVDEFQELLSDEGLTAEERDGVCYSIAASYYNNGQAAECLEYFEQIKSHAVFKKDELYKKIKAFIDEKSLAGEVGGSIIEGEETTDINLNQVIVEPERSVFEDSSGEAEEERLPEKDDEDDGVEFEIEFDAETVPVPAPQEETSALTEEPGAEAEETEEILHLPDEPDDVVEHEDLNAFQHEEMAEAPDEMFNPATAGAIDENTRAISELLEFKESVEAAMSRYEAAADLSESMINMAERLESLESRFAVVEDLNEKVDGLLEEMNGIRLEEIRLLAADLKEIKSTLTGDAFTEAVASLKELVEKNGPGVFSTMSSGKGREDDDDKFAEIRNEIDSLRNELGKEGAARLLDEMTEDMGQNKEEPDDADDDDSGRISYF